MTHRAAHHSTSGRSVAARRPRSASRHSHRARTPRRTPAVLATLAVLLLTVSLATAIVSRGDGAGAADSPNLVLDPEFANGAGAWTVPAGATLSIVPGYGGHRAISVTNVSSAARTIALNDKVNTVASTQVGVTYTASAWIKVSRPELTAAVREGAWKGSVAQGAAVLTSAWLRTADWRHVVVTYRATVAGASIDLNYLAWQLPPKVSLLVSQPSLTASGGTATTAPPASDTPSHTVSSSSSAASSTPATSSAPPATSSSAAPTSSAAAPSSTHSTTPPSDPTTPPAPPSSSAPPAGGKLVFDDEFSGSSVDRSKWNVRNDSWASNEESMVTSRSSNVSVGDGVLTIRAQRERYSAYGTTRDYTSGYLDTIGLSSHKYGRWEMRAKLPTAKGMWPAFWLRGDHSAGEVDILEAIGGLPKMTVQTVFPSTNDGSVKRSHAFNVSDTVGAWHVYGFTWTPSSMSWDVDGVTVFTVTSSDVAWESSAFTDTMNIRLNLQVGGSMPKYFNQEVDGTTPFPADYQVDYVRVYSL